MSMRALLVSYAFPPVGGAGVQRTVKLAKYLKEYDIEPSALTVANPSVPLQDHSHHSDLPEGMRVVRARTLEPDYAAKRAGWKTSAEEPASLVLRAKQTALGVARQCMIPDPQVLWLPCAAWALRQVLNGPHRPDVVFISSPPFSQFLLAPLCRATRGVGVVLDYRDEWATARTNYEMLGGALPAAVGKAMEDAVVPRAHVITTATAEFRDNLLKRYRRLHPDGVQVVTNGYDPDDFPTEVPSPPEDRFVLTYAGTIYRLTSARGLLNGIRRLHAARPELARLLEVRFIGRIVETERDSFEGMDALGVKQLGYVPHNEVLTRLGASHEVLCLLDDVPGVESVYPGKIFELMHLGRPVLTLSPPGALERLARQHQLGAVLPPRDEAGIAEYLEKQLTAFREARHPSRERIEFPDTAQYHRRERAGLFANAMRLAHERAR